MDKQKKTILFNKKRIQIKNMKEDNINLSFLNVEFDSDPVCEIITTPQMDMNHIDWNVVMTDKKPKYEWNLGYIKELDKLYPYFLKMTKDESSHEFKKMKNLNPYFFLDIKLKDVEEHLNYLHNLYEKILNKNKFNKIIDLYHDLNKAQQIRLYSLLKILDMNKLNFMDKKNLNYLYLSVYGKNERNIVNITNNQYIFGKHFKTFNYKFSNNVQIKDVFSISYIDNLYPQLYSKMDIIHFGLSSNHYRMYSYQEMKEKIYIDFLYVIYLLCLYQSKDGYSEINLIFESTPLFYQIFYLFSCLYEKVYIQKNIRHYYPDIRIKIIGYKFKKITHENLNKIRSICIEIQSYSNKKTKYIEQIFNNHLPILFVNRIARCIFQFNQKLYFDILLKKKIIELMSNNTSINKKIRSKILKKQINLSIDFLKKYEELSQKLT